MNWVYTNIYQLTLQTPSREYADEVAAFFSGLFIAIHAEMALLSVLFGLGIALEASVVKLSTLGVFVICLGGPFLYYQTFSNGRRVIESLQKRSSRPNLATAIALVVETLMLPFVVITVMIVSRS